MSVRLLEDRSLSNGITTIRRVETKQKLIALTFDDGPNASWTEVKLRALGEFGATATFFCLGQYVDQFPFLAGRIVRAGNEIGNHTYNHPYLTGLGYEEIFAELERTRRAIVESTRTFTHLFRPAYGEFDDIALAAAADVGYRYNVLWDVDPSDYLRPSPEDIADRVLRAAHPGSIVVMHDWVPETAQTLPFILEELRATGFHAVTVSTLLRVAGNARGNV